MHVLTQREDETTYPIVHNLGTKRLKIAVFDDTNSKEVKPVIRVKDENSVEICFDKPVEGGKFYIGIKVLTSKQVL